jgi:KDO2-lipid IV(A) lauroyltransferase
MEFILTLISRLPFKVLYVISDMVYVLVYYLIGYRKNIVRKNLTASFPEKNEKELREIERKFYHWLCDYFVETLKLLTITPEEMKKHLEFRGLEKLVEVKNDGQGVSAFLGHYCNWEWLSAAKLYWPWQDAEMGLIYHPLRNEKFDRLMLNMRSSLGGVCIPKQHILRELVALRRKGQDYQFGYIFDQSPKWDSIHLWLDFLHQKTPVFTGAERIAKKVNDLVVFVSMERPERGKYVANYHIISDNPKELPEYELTKRGFAMLENDIRRNPEFYLWTHNRWKRTYDEYLKKIENNKL